MDTITAARLADDLALALQCGTFGDAVRVRLQADLDAWTAQQANADAGRIFIRQWWVDHAYSVQSLAYMTPAERVQLARDCVAYHQTYGATDLNHERLVAKWEAEITRLYGATAGRGGDVGTRTTDHDASIIG